MNRECFVCGKEVPFAERVAVLARRSSQGTIWIHQSCATRFAAGVLDASLSREGTVQQQPGERSRRLAVAHTDLTRRELRVLQLMSNGYTNRQIATELDIAIKTARNRVSIILAKLDAINRTQAVAIAVREGLLEEE